MLLSSDAHIFNNASVYDNARVSGTAYVFSDAYVFDNAHIFGDAHIYGDARLFGNARVSDNAQVYGNAKVSGDAEVYGKAGVSGNAQVYGNVKIDRTENLLVVGPIGSRNSYTTFVKSDNGIIYVTCFIASRYFNGTIDELEKEVLNTYDKFSEYRRRYLNAIKMVKEVFKC